MPSLPTVYFPIESKIRELPSRILISRYLLPFGFKAVVGFNDAVVSGSRWWPRGIYFLKGMNAVQKRMATIFKAQEHRVVAIDEEALGISDKWFLSKDVDQEIGPLIDKVFCQGAKHRDALVTHGDFAKENFDVSGNPRVDFLNTRLRDGLNQEAGLIRDRHGRFLLVNTNSGSINNLWGDLQRYLGLLIEIGWFDPENPDDRALVDDHLEHDRNNFHKLRELIQTLSRNRSDIPIIVRPHPSEASSTWHAFANTLENVDVVADTEPAPWIMASEIVLTTGCTTGLEAVLLGKPAISLVDQPEHVRHPSFFVSNEVSVVSNTVSDAVDMITRHWDGEIDLAHVDANRRSAALHSHLELGGDELASERVARAIATDPDLAGMAEDRPVAIHPEQETHLRRIVKRVKWDKGSFSSKDIESWLQHFDRFLGPGDPVNVREIGWSTYELSL